MGVRMAGFGGNGPRDDSRKAGHSGRKTARAGHSGRKTARAGHSRRRGTARGSQWNDDNFVVIDVESVVEIDSPESMGTQLQGYSVPNVISIDDDDDDDYEVERDEGRDYAEHPAGGAECNSEGSPQGRSSENSPASDDMPNAASSGDSDDCRVFEENGRAFNLSRCSKSNAAEGLSRNRYGLDSELGSDSSDCEILEGSSTELREQWEKAFSRRKSCRGRSGVRDQASPSSSHGHSDADCGVGSSRGKNAEAPESSNFKNLNGGEFGFFSSNGEDDGLEEGGGSAHHNMADGFSKSDPKYKEGSCSLGLNPKSQGKAPMYEENDTYFNVKTNMEDYSFFSEEGQHSGNSCTWFRNKGKAFHGSTTCFSQDLGDNDWDHLRNGAHDDIEQDTGAGTAFPDSTSMHRTSTDKGKIGNESSVTEGQRYGGRENVIPETFDENGGDRDTGTNNGSQWHKLGTKVGVSSLSEGEDPLKKTLDQTELHKPTDQSCTPPGIRTDGVSRDIINEREKLKETDEYKQAVEQEWLARQKQLQIQAEEAQRLRKRKKAESSRALDMERRQKQRLEEIRETQKKDEEDLNMKDQLRSEIRKELGMLEMTCFDMASLLRRLGIPVGFYPLSNEVRAAYKRALLKFHPDRVSSSDVRQQVEAEEKFKLICRMKDKFKFPS